MDRKHGLRRAAALTAACCAAVLGKTSIVGGHNITIADAPWQMLFQIEEDGGTGQCGASWIGGRWAMTAAHCVEGATPDRCFLWAGITTRQQAKTTNRIKVSRIIANADFPKTWKDIALLEMAADVTSTKAKPIPFATTADSKAGLTNPGVTVMMTGWGGVNKDGQLADTLQALITKVRDTTRYVMEFVPKGATPDQGSCGGDSGGPAVVHDATGTAWIVAGISSYIESYCGDTRTPSSYSRVSAFTSWIQQNTGMSTGGIDPRETHLAPLRDGRIRLDRAQRVEISIVNALGVSIDRSSGFEPAGELALPTERLAPGAYVFRIKGETLNVTQPLRVLH